LKVLHIAPTPFFSDRGCHIRILSILRAIEHSGGKNMLCTYPLGRDLPNVDIRRVGAVRGYERTEAGPQRGKILADLKLLFLGLRTAFREKPDVLHAHLHEGVLIAWLIRVSLFWRGLPLVADLQGGLVGELADHGFFARKGVLSSALRFAFTLVEALILKLPAHSFCSSGNSERIFREDYRLSSSRLTRLDDRVDLDAYDPQNVTLAKVDLPKGVFVVAYSGSLLPIKGLDVLQQVILLLKRKRSNIVFLLIGYPTDLIEAFVEKHALHNSVRIIGRVAFEELPTYLLRANVGVEPKQSASGEGSGKLLHYMAAGLALAAFPTPHNREFAGDQALAGDDTPEALAAHIETLADDPLRCNRIGKENREKIAPYSLQSGGRVITQVYEQLGIVTPTLLS